MPAARKRLLHAASLLNLLALAVDASVKELPKELLDSPARANCTSRLLRGISELLKDDDTTLNGDIATIEIDFEQVFGAAAKRTEQRRRSDVRQVLAVAPSRPSISFNKKRDRDEYTIKLPKLDELDVALEAVFQYLPRETRNRVPMEIHPRYVFHLASLPLPIDDADLQDIGDARRTVVKKAAAMLRVAYAFRRSPTGRDLTQALNIVHEAISLLGPRVETAARRDEIARSLAHALADESTAPPQHATERGVRLLLGIELALQQRYAFRFTTDFEIMRAISRLTTVGSMHSPYARYAWDRWYYVFIASCSYAGKPEEVRRQIEVDVEEMLSEQTEGDSPTISQVELHTTMLVYEAALKDRDAVTRRTAKLAKLLNSGVTNPERELIHIWRVLCTTDEHRLAALNELNSIESPRYIGDQYVEILLDTARKDPTRPWDEIVAMINREARVR
jgi:hypothetical protein